MKKRNEIMCLFASLFLLSTAILGAAQATRQIAGLGITVFVDRNFRGTAQTFQRDVPDLRPFGLNRRISSLRIGPGEQWEVCAEPNYQGGCLVISGEESDLRRNNWNDRISSFRRVGGGPPPITGGEYIVLFDQTNYRGNPTNLYAAVPVLNRRARSVTIGRGVWQLCEGNHFTGPCVILDTSTPDIGSHELRRVASARPVGSSGGINAPPSPSDWYVVLFDQPNFRGNPTNFNGQQSNLSRNVRSVTIGKGVWELCDGRFFTGRCVTLNSSVPDLSGFNIGRRIGSLRPLVRQR